MSKTSNTSNTSNTSKTSNTSNTSKTSNASNASNTSNTSKTSDTSKASDKSKSSDTVANKKAFDIYLRLLKNIKKYRRSVALVIVGLISLGIVEVTLYKILIPKVVDEGFIDRSPAFIKAISVFIFFLFIARGISSFFITYFMGDVGRSVVRDFRRRILEKMMRLPVSYFQTRSSGDLLSKVNYDAEQVAASISNAIADSLRGGFIFIGMLYVMFSTSWQITTCALFVGPILAYYLKSISTRMRRHSTNVQTSMGEVTQVANEVIDGYQVIKSFDGINYETERVKLATENNKKQEMKMYFATAISIPIMQCIGAITLSVLIYSATLKSLSLSAGEFMGMFGALLATLRPIKQMASINSILQRGIAASKSIFGLLDETPELDLGTKKLNRAKGDIKFEKVYFDYNSSDEKDSDETDHVLSDINFSIKAGETAALVGSSGSGKSTIAALLPRFFNVERGRICIDGVDIKNYRLRDLRKQIAIVTQDVILFNDTIANNIAYGSKGTSTLAEICNAAHAAFVTEFTERLPEGLDTMIGENGVKLSGGQRQRIAIARAILKNSPILILDEATSALDTESERYIQRALDEVVKNRTTLIIAHRLSTIENVDKIFVIESGKIVEFGSHSELIASADSRYAKLRSVQFN